MINSLVLNSHTRFLIAIIALIFCSFSSVSASPSGPIKEVISNEDACNLPAPSNFQVVSATTSSISLSWNPVAGASQYWLHAEEVSTGTVYFDGPVSGTNTTVGGLPAGKVFNFWLCAVCSNNQNSGNQAVVTGKTDFIIVQDIVVSRDIQYPSVLPPCISFPISTFEENFFLAQKVGGSFETSGVFSLQRNISQSGQEEVIFRQYGTKSASSQFYVFTEHNNGIPTLGIGNGGIAVTEFSTVKAFFGTPNVGGSSDYALRRNSVVNPNSGPNNWALKFTLEHPQNQTGALVFCWSDPVEGQASGSYIVKSEIAYPPYVPGSGNGYGKVIQSFNPNTPSIDQLFPNPFTDQLNINLDKPAEGLNTLRLVSLNGQVLLEHQIQEGTDVVRMETADLAPGMYLLRLESAEGLKTYKVVKAQ